MSGIEIINYRALGGADIIATGDLASSGMQQLNVDLAVTAGTGTATAFSTP